MRTQITDRTIGAHRLPPAGRRDYPSMRNSPLRNTGAGSNDVDYSNREFDGAATAAQAAPTPPESQTLTNTAQQIPLQDTPVVPLWDYIGAGRQRPSTTW